MSASGGGNPSLNMWKALLDFSTRNTEPEPNRDVKPMSKGAAPAAADPRLSVSGSRTSRCHVLVLQRMPRS
jgi:hypothetical protein